MPRWDPNNAYNRYYNEMRLREEEEAADESNLLAEEMAAQADQDRWEAGEAQALEEYMEPPFSNTNSNNNNFNNSNTNTNTNNSNASTITLNNRAQNTNNVQSITNFSNQMSTRSNRRRRAVSRKNRKSRRKNRKVSSRRNNRK